MAGRGSSVRGKRFFYDLRLLVRRLVRPPLSLSGGAMAYPVPPSADVPRLDAALRAVQESEPAAAPWDEAAPVFVLGVGWRTGSTLLQRICSTDSSLLMWGEPLGNMGFITRMAEGLCMADPDGWPWADAWLTPDIAESAKTSDRLVTDFTANLGPPRADLRASLQAWLGRWLGDSAREQGFVRWGLKEVRLGGTEARFLQWLFPKARFVAIARHPLDAYRSVRDAGGAVWIEPRARDEASFARHWNHVATGLGSLPTDFPLMTLRFEDLVAGTADLKALAAHLQLTLEPSRALAVKAGASTKERSVLEEATRTAILEATEEGREGLGYGDAAAESRSPASC